MLVFRLDCFCLSSNMILEICNSEEKQNDFGYYYYPDYYQRINYFT